MPPSCHLDMSDLKIRRREARTATAAVEQDWGESRRARQKQKHYKPCCFETATPSWLVEYQIA